MHKNKNLTIQEIFGRAVKNHQEGKTDIARDLYNQILKIDPNHEFTLNNLGALYKKLVQIQKAKKCFEKAIKINPNYVDAHNNLGLIFKDLQENQKAKECYEKAIKINPSFAKAHYNLGIIFKELGEYQKAKDCYEKVIELDPNYIAAYNNLGNIFKELREFEKAKECYEKAIAINPNYATAHNNLGVIFKELGEYQKAKDCYEKAIEINPNYAGAHYNLGVIFKDLEEHQKAKDCFEKVIEINPSHAVAHNNLGIIFQELGENQKAKDCYEKAIEINPNHVNAHFNLGIIFQELGENQKAKDCYEKAIEIDPNYAGAHNNLGVIFQALEDYQKAKDCYDKAIKIDPNNTNAYWNMYTCASNIDEALMLLNKLYKIDNKHTKAKIMISALKGYKGDFKMFDEVLNSPDANHPHMRSVKWVFSLPKLPKIFFDRWSFFDTAILLAESSKPFYEFGVYNGVSFQYLINTIKKGFGFDTFTGLPEAWDNHPKGSYSSYGAVPKIKGGEFIVGKFEDTLPDFFSKERPMASLINFDADLYSSTLCALNHSNKVIDEKTILIFDELIIGKDWENDEFKALNEFCDNLGYAYEVLAISFVTRQVAVKLIR